MKAYFTELQQMLVVHFRVAIFQRYITEHKFGFS
jgi:hypothetical protein